jgi:O-antigen/teichoic acid export membrane protein
LSVHAGRPTLQSTLLKSLSTAGLLMCFGALLVSAFATQTLQFAFGSGYSISVAATVLAILVWRVPIIMFRSHARQALFVMGYLNTELICSLISVVILVPLAYWATRHYGIIGLAIAATVSELAGAIATWMVWMYVWRGVRPLTTALRYE